MYFIIIVFLSCLCACKTSFLPSNVKPIINEIKEVHKEPKIIKPKTFHEKIVVEIPLANNLGKLNAEILRPIKKSLPKTVIILVPGSGNVSKEGEGLETAVWSEAFTSLGFFTLAYDKRTCQKEDSTLCNDNPVSDIYEKGIQALSEDLDQVCEFVKQNNKLSSRIERLVLFSSGQGAQTISKSKCLKEANQVILISPILDDLEKTFIFGLHNLKQINKEESMKNFFSSLKEGKFPKEAIIKGTSVAFWLSWLKTSKETIPHLKQSKKNILVIFSKKDPFYDSTLKPRLTFLTLREEIMAGKNFIINDEVSPQALKYVKEFLSSY